MKMRALPVLFASLVMIGGARAQALDPSRDGQFVISPDYAPAPELTASAGVPAGTIHTFTMRSEDSKLFPGVKRFEPGHAEERLPDEIRLADPSPGAIQPFGYTRDVWVYVPAGYVPGTPSPLLVVQDGRGQLKRLPPILDNLIAQKRVPALVAVMISSGGGSARGEERNLEYDTLSGRYSDFVETEVLPRIARDYAITFTSDPEGRASLGGSSGGIAAFSMAWFHPERYRRVISYSGSFTNLQAPRDPALPFGGWHYPDLVAKSLPKPIRVWMEVGENDLRFDTLPDGAHLNWPLANERTRDALSAKGYPLQYVFAKGAGHTDAKVYDATLAEALEWLWRGYGK